MYRRTMEHVSQHYTAVITQQDDWLVGWIEEVPGVNAQERTKDELLASLREALFDILEYNRQQARLAAGDDYYEERVAL